MKAIWLISQFELSRLFLTQRGIFLLLAFAIVWFFILKVLVIESVSIINDPVLRDQISSWFGQVKLDYLLDWPYSELAVFWLISVFIYPFFTMLITADQTASDTKRGLVRFLLLRASRSQLFLGRFLGKMLIIFILMILTVLATLAMGVSRNPDQLFASLPQLFLILGNLIILCLPYCALMALLNSLSQSTIISLIFAFILIPLISATIGSLSNSFEPILYLRYALPGVQLTDTIQLANFHLSSILIPLSQTALYLGLTQLIFTRKSL
jgi:ABC-type transport system involved in multi-copper enzyme maturation permease subunit